VEPVDASSDRVQRRILALLEKAASTPFEAEAEAAMSKAFQMMARHHVDVAVLEARREAQDPSRIVEERVELGRGPYVNGRLSLLVNVSTAVSVRCLTSVDTSGRLGHLIGHRSDVARAILLYTSLHAHAAARMAASAPRPRARGRQPASSVTRFRRSFLFGFAAKVGERLDEATGAARAAGPTSTALVLADRTARVDAWVERTYGRLGTHRAVGVGAAGWTAGAEAAADADLTTSDAVGRPRRALGA
jgi:hypothetical protein